MQSSTHGFMDGYGFMGGNGLWTVLAVLLAVFLVVATIRMLQKK
jgi:uncharacterized membrane protein